MISERSGAPVESREALTEPGVLKLAGLPHAMNLDPVCVNSPRLAQLARLSTRSLFGYVGDPTPRSWRPITPLPDLAAMVPSIYNAGAGASGRSFVVMLRPDVMWDTTPPRPVTAQDVIRGIKRLGNPVARPASVGYFTRTIRGMAEFCAGFEEAVGKTRASAEQLVAYQNEHEIAGVFALDEQSLMFELTRPALDLPHLLALPCAAPAPVEYDAFVPGSAELNVNLRATGPYRPVHDGAQAELRWEPNPVWRANTDPLRDRHLDSIRICAEPTASYDLRRELTAGRIDLPLGVAVRAPEPHDDDVTAGWALDHLVINPQGADASAVGEHSLRRRIADAIDAAARSDLASIAMAVDPGQVAQPATSLIPPARLGQRRHTSPTGASANDAAEACDKPVRGGEESESIVLIHARSLAGGPLAESVAGVLARAGFVVQCVAAVDDQHQPIPADDHCERWDIALMTHLPEWAGMGERVHVERFATGLPVAEGAVVSALDAVAEPARAAELWREAERLVLDDARVIPLLFRAPSGRPVASDRLGNVLTLSAFAGDEVDLAALRLPEGT